MQNFILADVVTETELQVSPKWFVEMMWKVGIVVGESKCRFLRSSRAFASLQRTAVFHNGPFHTRANTSK